MATVGPDEHQTSPKHRDVILLVVRFLFVLILGGTAAKIAQDLSASSDQVGQGSWMVVGAFVAVMALGGLALILDIAYPKKRISSISAVFFGLIVGSILGYFLKIAFAPTLSLWLEEEMINWCSVILTALFCYICVSVLLQTKNDFRFVIPYVEFAPQIKGSRPLILDSSVIMDGRIADIADSGLVDQVMVIPVFVLEEIQSIADHHDKIRRKRGIRGLETVDRLKRSSGVDLDIRSDEGMEVAGRGDIASRLVHLTKSLNGRLMTNDLTLSKTATIHNIDTINLNEVSNAFKPPVLWGDKLSVSIVKEGEEPGQGVGFLDDGTMVVVDMGKRFIGHEVNVVVDSFLQTSAGRIVFCRIDSKNPSPSHATA